MIGSTLSAGLVKARRVNQTSAAYVAKIPVVAEPMIDVNSVTGMSVFDLGDFRKTGEVVNGIFIMPYAVGADNTTGNVQVIGWKLVLGVGADTTKQLWIPILLADFAYTVSAVYPGIALKEVLATELFADTMTLTLAGNANVSIETSSPGTTTADSGIAWAKVDLAGCQKVELSFKIGTATSCNALVSFL